MTIFQRLAIAGLYALLVVVFVKNAWMSDDAYITFRSVEQLIAGNGARWNAFERVQVYTSTSWYFLLAFARLLIVDIYYAALLVSFICCAAAVWLIRKTVPSFINYGLLLLGLMTSPTIVDFTTSGLENPLGYLLVALLGWLIFGVSEASRFRLSAVIALAGFTPLVRHDLVILIWPAVVGLLYQQRESVRWRSVAAWVVIAALPLVCWTLFSLLYYGLPFPNTAYAKLNTGIDKGALLRAGVNYLWVSGKHDPVAAVVVVVGIASGLIRSGIYRIIAASVLLHVAYVVYVGGDFMRGRFLSFDIFLLAIMLAQSSRSATLSVGVTITAALALVLSIMPASTLFPDSYLFTQSGVFFYTMEIKDRDKDVVDEKYFYFVSTGLIPRLQGWAMPRNDQMCKAEGDCVNTKDLQQCPYRNPSSHCVVVEQCIGLFGYQSGLAARIVDFLALSDPLLAQLPMAAGASFRVGHAPRKIPAGYLDSIASDRNVIKDKRVSLLYDQIKLITQSESLFDMRRLRAIWLLNSGQLKLPAGVDYE